MVTNSPSAPHVMVRVRTTSFTPHRKDSILRSSACNLRILKTGSLVVGDERRCPTPLFSQENAPKLAFLEIEDTVESILTARGSRAIKPSQPNEAPGALKTLIWSPGRLQETPYEDGGAT
ncbi:hypothetical protein A0H81_14687 [Grifola frondosa]|uniref:Uncharacterized protein n=1 Tax=Grifola frondosa TaxID=5627 RepID=A0A1C7LKL3_GRIFR|nr:hypothetical protein A0H81_14687 [Grifola frondosa]